MRRTSLRRVKSIIKQVTAKPQLIGKKVKEIISMSDEEDLPEGIVKEASSFDLFLDRPSDS